MEKQTIVPIKEIILGVCAPIASIIVFWLWSAYAIPAIGAGDFRGATRFIAPTAGLAFASALFALAAMFIRDPRIAYGSAAAGVGGPYFFTDASVPVLLLALASMIGIAFAAHKIRREFSLSVGFSVSKTAKSGLPLYFTVACAVISLFYANGLRRENSFASILPKPAFDFTLHYFLNSELAQSATGIPEVRRDITMDELLDMLARRQLEEREIPAPKISPADLARIRALEREEIGRRYGIAFRGDEKVEDVFYGAIAERADELLGPWRAYIPFISSLAFFFALKALTLPLYIVSLVILSLLIKALLFANILRRTVQSIEVERIAL